LNAIFPSVVTEDMQGMKYLKVFVNANNCIPAILGISIQEAFAEPFISRVAVAVWKEGMDLVSRTGTHLDDLPDFPVLRLTRLTSLPAEEAAKIFSGIMTNLSREPLYGSILQSIKRGRASEIDYINGEFVTLAKDHKLNAPLNEKLVALVHQVEREKKFFTRNEFLASVKGLV
jgi:2-dehydropantoate 2-reductase